MARVGFKGRFPSTLGNRAALRAPFVPPANSPLPSPPPGSRHTRRLLATRAGARDGARLSHSQSWGELGARSSARDPLPLPPYALIRRRALPLSLGWLSRECGSRTSLERTRVRHRKTSDAQLCCTSAGSESGTAPRPPAGRATMRSGATALGSGKRPSGAEIKRERGMPTECPDVCSERKRRTYRKMATQIRLSFKSFRRFIDKRDLVTRIPRSQRRAARMTRAAPHNLSARRRRRACGPGPRSRQSDKLSRLFSPFS